ncbi:hypothetical protein PCLA_02f0242 [Pseudomonas citronellolis]|nr:hypothetical protein PCLA_02f0242 [Pseudomonas citronellolis]
MAGTALRACPAAMEAAPVREAGSATRVGQGREPRGGSGRGRVLRRAQARGRARAGGRSTGAGRCAGSAGPGAGCWVSRGRL